jgi:ribosomal protein S18 acetylase RimI-like enzyme
MSWHVTESRAEFEAAAGPYLRSDPVLNTVLLTVLETLRQQGDGAISRDAPLFGWHGPDGGAIIDGAFLRTGSYPPFVTSGQDLDALVRQLGAPLMINLPEPAATQFGRAWTERGGHPATVARQMRLHRLEKLVPPAPSPPGAARIAGPDDYDLLAAWTDDFGAETATGPGSESRVRDGVARMSFVLWEHAGQPVAMASLSPMVDRVVRIRAVYTPPEHRRLGYGAAVTTAATQVALDSGAADVVLFTDLANPTSNALYRRLGYRAIADRTELSLG